MLKYDTCNLKKMKCKLKKMKCILKLVDAEANESVGKQL